MPGTTAHLWTHFPEVKHDACSTAWRCVAEVKVLSGAAEG